jgi:hypothetical protein
MRPACSLSFATCAFVAAVELAVATTTHDTLHPTADAPAPMAQPQTEVAWPRPELRPDPAPPRLSESPDGGVVDIFQIAVEFVTAATRRLEEGGAQGVIIRLLVIVEVLIAALGVICCITVWGRGKADLVLKIIDVMGSLFLVITLLIAALAVV